MRNWLLLLLMALLGLQSVQAACVSTCHPTGAADPVRSARASMSAPLHAGHFHAGVGHGGAHHDPSATATRADMASAQPGDVPDAASPSGHAGCTHGDGGDCCHATVPLPSRHAFVAAPPEARAHAMPVRLPALSHAADGPFRPPRSLFA